MSPVRYLGCVVIGWWYTIQHATVICGCDWQVIEGSLWRCKRCGRYNL